MELLSLSAPWILLLLTVVVIVALAFKKWKLAVPLLLVVIVGNLYFETLPLNVARWFSSSFQKTFSQSTSESTGCFKVMTFNCNLSPKHPDIEQRREKVAQFILQQDVDAVFLAENFTHKEDSLWLKVQDKFPYHSQTRRANANSIYSKYPILCDTTYREKGKGYGITFCLIDHQIQTIDVYGVHLSSNNYNDHNEYMTPDSVDTSDQAKAYLKNIITAGQYREREAETINGNLNPNVNLNSNDNYSLMPIIVMGDFNDVCGSPSINILETGGLKDAWWKGGLGYGATIHYPLPYRIDHIFYNDKLKLKSIKKIDCKGLSDHDALVAEFGL